MDGQMDEKAQEKRLFTFSYMDLPLACDLVPVGGALY